MSGRSGSRGRGPRCRRTPRRSPRCSSWRSSSMRSPERTMPWSSAMTILIRLLLTATHTRSLMRVPTGGLDSISSSPPTSSARSRIPGMPRPDASSSGVEAVAVVADAARGPRRCREAHADVLGARVLHHVRERLLSDPVGDELGLGLDAEKSPSASKLGSDVGLAPDLLDVAGERGLEAEVVERGRAQPPRQRQAAPPSPGGDSLVSASSRATSGGAFSPPPRDAAGRR